MFYKMYNVNLISLKRLLYNLYTYNGFQEEFFHGPITVGSIVLDFKNGKK